MQILEAALASALVLLSFATIVTIIMEIVLRVLGIKAKGFEEIAQAMFDDVLLPRFKKELGKIKGLKGKNLKEKIKNAFENYKSIVSTKDIAPIDQGKKKIFFRLLSPKFLMRRYSKPDNISVEDFFEKLAGSEIGQALSAKAQGKMDSTIADLAKKYERLGSEVREDFIRNSGFMTQVLGIALAFALNLNVVTFFTTFMSDPELTQGIIAQKEKILKTYQDREKSFQDEINKNGKAGETPKSQEETDKVKNKVTETQDKIKEIKEDVTSLRESLDNDLYESLPMGYGDFPYCWVDCKKDKESLEDKETPEEKESLEDKVSLKAIFFTKIKGTTPEEIKSKREVISFKREKATSFLFPWVLSVFLTGILIGLGGPFWYNLVMKLSGIVQSVRGKTQASKPAAGGAPPAAGQPAKSPLVEKYSTAIDAFKLAAENLPPPEKT